MNRIAWCTNEGEAFLGETMGMQGFQKELRDGSVSIP